MPRACDSCSIRKIKCNGRSPCDACLVSSLPCLYLRRLKKSGPKGPRKRTKEAILQIQQTSQDSDGSQCVLGVLRPSTPRASSGDVRSGMSTPHSSPPTRRIPISTFTYYLNTYQNQLYFIWPIVNWRALLIRLRDADDNVAYALAASICAATMAQLHLDEDVNGHSNQSMACEAENAQFLLDYPKHQMIDGLLTYFFLHVFYSNIGKFTKSTLRLRDAITYAHLMGLHQDSFYVNLCPDVTQYHLRIAWILFITDRAHSHQHGIPPTFKLSPSLPELRPEDDAGSAFCSLCKLFQSFEDACPLDSRSERTGFLGAITSQLRQTHPTPTSGNELQRADLVVSDSWLRVVLWKEAIPYVDSTIDPNDQGFSVSFPMSVATDLLSKLTTISSCALEAHGPGMMSKLFEIASSVADVIICAPRLADVESMQVGPREVLCALSSLITSLRTTGDPALLILLREKMMACAMDQAGPGRLMQITDGSVERTQGLDDGIS